MSSVARTRLPSHHVRRERITSRCASSRIVVVEAAGGYGKSVLAAELVQTWGALPIWVLLEDGGVSERLLAARLRAAAARAGLRDAAAAMAAVGDDPSGAIDALLAGSEGESCAIVIDDAHHAESGAARLVARIADQLVDRQRLVVLARHLPPGLGRLRRAAATELRASDLALRAEETIVLCRAGFGLDVSDEEAGLLDIATGGWAAAVVLAASRAKHTSQPLGAVVRLGESLYDAVESILEDSLSTAGFDAAWLAQLAALPLLDRELVDLVAGSDGAFDRALAWGLPMSLAEGRWWELPGPVREHLGRLGPSDPAVLRTAAGYYESHGQLAVALQMLLSAGDAETAARLLDETEPWVVDRIDALELLAVLDRIPREVVERFPRGMLTVARCCGAAWMMTHQLRLLERLDEIVDATETPELRRAVEAELIVPLVDRGEFAEAEARARRLLDTVGPDERLTLARAHSIYASTLCFRRDPDGRVDVAAVRDATRHFDESTKIQLELGNRAAAATVALLWSLWAEFALGRPVEALAVLDRGLSFAADHPKRFMRLLAIRALVLAELGRQGEVDDDLAELTRMAHAYGDPWMLVYGDWQRMVSASLRGDADATLQHAREMEARQGEWWRWEGAMFLADAAEALDRVGHAALAADCLERARRDPQNSAAAIAMAECALLARHGDPALAEHALSDVERLPEAALPPREYWRVTLFRAYAAQRSGHPSAGGIAARAFEEAARLGQPNLPLIKEREISESLLALARDTGSPAALALETSSLPVALSVLGRFELTRGGRPVPLAGQAQQLLKFVAANGGRVQTEQAIEALWPEAPPETGRNRLRTVLGRLRDAAGDVVSREGEHLALDSEVRLDLVQFHREAREARALAAGDPTSAVAIARSAIARYRGPLLPHDPYEVWADEPRGVAQSTMLNLLDLCAAAATERGDLDETRRIIERTIELAPYDDDRYLKVALILEEQGKKGAALSVLDRARSALAQLGIDPPRQLAELERSIAAAGTMRSVETDAAYAGDGT